MTGIKHEDKITRLMHATIVLTKAVITVGDVRVAGESFRVDSPQGGSDKLEVDDEGVTWIRGWHMPESNEVMAARGAQALTPTASRKPKVPASMGQQLLGAALGSFAHEMVKSFINGDLTKKP